MVHGLTALRSCEQSKSTRRLQSPETAVACLRVNAVPAHMRQWQTKSVIFGTSSSMMPSKSTPLLSRCAAPAVASLSRCPAPVGYSFDEIKQLALTHLIHRCLCGPTPGKNSLSASNTTSGSRLTWVHNRGAQWQTSPSSNWRSRIKDHHVHYSTPFDEGRVSPPRGWPGAGSDQRL